MVSKKRKEDEYIKLLTNALKTLAVGAAILTASFIAYNKEAEANTITMETTYYTADCSGCSGITAAGYDVRGTIYVNGYRVVAVDPWLIPLGTIVYVETPYESFYAIAGDVGGGISGFSIDVLVGSHWEALNKGRVQSTVTVLEWGD